METKIFVEGKHDKEFLEAYLKFLGFSAEIISCNGNKIKDSLLSVIQQAKDEDQKVLVIFDADYDFDHTLERLKNESNSLLQDDEIFLFPNNSQQGELETLLFEIADKPQIHQCFEKYKNCIENHNPNYRKNIHKKSARYAYIEALGFSLSEDQKEKQKRKEAYPKIFDFNSPCLDPLKDFLQKIL